MTYRAIAFDYWGVVKGRPWSVFIDEVCAILDITPATWNEAYFQHNTKVNRGEITWPEMWDLVLGEIGQPDRADEVYALNRQYIEVGTLNQDVLNIVRELRAAGYKTGLLSNNRTGGRQQAMQTENLPAFFDVIHVSQETGFVKPEPKAFAHLAQALGVAPTELIFIDDVARSLERADEVGYTPILFTSVTQLRDELVKLGVL